METAGLVFTDISARITRDRESDMYAMKDDKSGGGLLPVTLEKAIELNQEGYGIFETVNETKGLKGEDLIKIRAWYVDIDCAQGQTKKALKTRLLKGPVIPTRINETRRGFHAFWEALDPTEENYRTIQEGLYTYYKGDRLKNPTRVLRAPGFYHWKKVPYLVETIHETSDRYSENLMKMLYPAPEKKAKTTTEGSSWTSDFWRTVGELDCGKALLALSGHACVGGEIYTFRENGNNTRQILVDGKTTGAWIDEEGKIGSYSGGGPTIVQWLKYYGLSWGQIAQMAKSVLGVKDDQ